MLLSLSAQHKSAFFSLPPNLSGKKILFLGDSITQAGDYINFFECQLRLLQPEASFEVYNLGLGSETISGLSEDNHPYPRPYLHDRLDKALDFIQPDLIFACYGINCGIYHPFSEHYFEKYQQGIRNLIAKANQIQAELILLTPPPYASPIDDWIEARADYNRSNYSYAEPYAAYDDVMRRYGEWILSLKEVQSIDIQTPMRRFQELCYNEDVIHPNLFGHQLMAHVILKNLKLGQGQKKQTEVFWDENSESSDDKRIKRFHLNAPANAYVVLSENQEYNELIAANLDFTLKIRDCPPATYQLFDQDFYLGEITLDALEKMISISPLSHEVKYDHLSFVKKAQQLYDVIAAKREVYDYALLQHIGHRRPMNREGLPIALAEKKRDSLLATIRRLLDQRNWDLEMIRV